MNQLVQVNYPRRRFIQGVGGLLSLSFAEKLLGASTQQTDHHTAARIIFVYHPDGVFLEQWQPEQSSGTLIEFPESLLPLKPYRNQLSVLRHLNLFDGRGDGHEEASRCLLTGSTRPHLGSIDVLIAERFQQALLHAGVLASKSGGQSVSFLPGGAEKVADDNPIALYQRLFGDIEGRLSKLDVDILNSVYKELEAYKKYVEVDLEKIKLDQHAKQIELLMKTDDVCGGFDLDKFDYQADQKWNDRYCPTIVQMQMLNLITALECGISRVATLQISRHTSPLKMDFDWLDRWNDQYAMESHQASHNSGIIHAQQKKWINTQIATMLEALDSRPEPNKDRSGSMLDNSLVVVVSEISQGASHSRVDMPFYIAGGKAIQGYDTGRVLDCQGASHTQLLVSLSELMGQSAQGHFAGDTRLNGLVL